MRALSMMLVVLVAGCGGSALVADAGSGSGYAADRAACGEAAEAAVDRQNAKRALAWFASPVTRWGQRDTAVAACLEGKGWGRVRVCTAEELRQGGSGGGVGRVRVTARGISCMDPGVRG